MFNDVSQWCIGSRNFSLIDIGITRASSHGEASHRTAMVSSLWNHDSESLKDHEKSPFVMIFLNHHIKSPGVLEKIMVNITTCFSHPWWADGVTRVARTCCGSRQWNGPTKGRWISTPWPLTSWQTWPRCHPAPSPCRPGDGGDGGVEAERFSGFFKDMMTGKNT